MSNSEDFPQEMIFTREPIEDPYAVSGMYPETCALCNKAKIMKVPMAPELCGFCAFKKGITNATTKRNTLNSFDRSTEHANSIPYWDRPL